MNEKRHNYLQNIWNAYPECSPSSVSGRLEACEEVSTGFEYVVSRNFELTRLKAVPLEGCDLESSLEILRLGDLVSVGNESLVLLVPSQTKKEFNSFDREMAQKWSTYMASIRSFFNDQNFIELATPSLVESPGVETYLEAFETRWERGNQTKKVFLPTSPEFHLKKALCAGFDKIYEIAKVYRNNEEGSYHQNEFWMLEWYRAFDDLKSIEQDLVSLVSRLMKKEIKPIRKSFAELFHDFLGFELKPDSNLNDLQKLAKKEDIHFSDADDFDDLFFRIYLDKIELNFKEIDWLVVHSFPPSQAALARLNSESWADRFELYHRGVELANAFHELNDPDTQEKRFKESLSLKIEKNLKEIPYDKELIEAMKFGMPPSGGIALGLDRLFMSVEGLKKIEETRLFPR